MTVVALSLAAIALAATASGLGPAGPAPCDVDGPGHIQKRVETAAPALVKSARLQKLFRNLRAVDPATTLDVDERHTTFTLVGDRPPPAVHFPLAMPAPWSGVIDIAPRAVERWCAKATVVLFDKDLRRADVEGLPVDISVTVAKAGKVVRTLQVKQDALELTPDWLLAKDGDAGELRIFIGDGPPDDDLLEQDGADLYMKSLAALGPDIIEDIRARPSAQAQRVLFAEVAAQLRTELRTWTPEKRTAEIARFDEKAMPPELRPLVHFWKEELGARKEKPDASAHVIVEDAVQALWIDGVEVFDRKKGNATSVEVRVPKDAVRAWIVTTETNGATTIPVVHDTRAVLKAGEIYSATSTFLQSVHGGTRRECVRFGGALPDGKDIRWREISGTHTPMLGDDESYRPSVAAAERAFSVVPGGDAHPFPPVPLVYSYTHPGLYKWTLAKDGGVRLELVEDMALCSPTP